MNAQKDAKDTSGSLGICQVIADELRYLYGDRFSIRPCSETCHEHHDRLAPCSSTCHEAQLATLFEQARALPRAALCLSGGGIRSATFALGVIQGLAHANLLDGFQYLSTVSGGGYIGSWLSAWAHRDGLRAVTKALQARPGAASAHNGVAVEPPQLRHLRRYSNYLTPRLGLLSADTWSLVAMYLRNLFLTWLIWLPLLLAVVAVPRLYVALPVWISHVPLLGAPISLLGVALLVLAAFYAGAATPSASRRSGKPGIVYPVRASVRGDPQPRTFLWRGLLPLVCGTILLTSLWAAAVGSTGWWARLQVVANTMLNRLLDAAPGTDVWGDVKGPKVVATIGFSLLELLLLIAGFVGYTWKSGRSGSIFDKVRTALRSLARDTSVLFTVVMVVCSPVIGVGLVILVGVMLVPPLLPGAWLAPAQDGNATLVYPVFGLPVLLLGFLMATAIVAGMCSWFIDDEDLEWWSRCAGWILAIIIGWIAVFGLTLGIWAVPLFDPTVSSTVLSTGFVSGAGTVLSGLSSLVPATSEGTGGERRGRLVEALSMVAGAMFAIVLIVMGTILSGFGIDYVGVVTARLAGTPSVERSASLLHERSLGSTTTLANVLTTPGLDVLLFVGLMGGVTLMMAYVVNTNRFSLHGMYRSRLIRAYLGASHKEGERHPDPFTGFDEHDDLPMHELWPGRQGVNHDRARRNLLHIVNMTLNLVGGKDLAWQERKAESFTVSPLHAGNQRLGYRSMEAPGDPEGKQFYGKSIGGMSLGTAMAISGAAASPNMGYHSSPLVTLLLALCNVRLGVWLGNPGPRGDETYYREYPRFSIKPMIAEALGLTTDTSDYVYISDGGHFENLGLYQMVQRRCSLIVVSDAGQDEQYAFEDLGGAVRKIRIDLGIPIEFRRFEIVAPREDGKAGSSILHFAVGEIMYSSVDGGDPSNNGVLMYLKPTLCGAESKDVLHYGKSHPGFPHDPTMQDQFFSESQFESYRALGCHTVEQALQKICDLARPGVGGAPLSLDDVTARAREYLKRR